MSRSRKVKKRSLRGRLAWLATFLLASFACAGFGIVALAHGDMHAGLVLLVVGLPLFALSAFALAQGRELRPHYPYPPQRP